MRVIYMGNLGDKNRRDFMCAMGGFACVSGALPFANTAFARDAKSPKLGQVAWDFLEPGDTIYVIAPSSPIDNPSKRYDIIRDYFKTHTALNVYIPPDLIEPTAPLEEANTIEKRVQFITEAFENPIYKAVWAIGGGGWGTSLLQTLQTRPKPQTVKPLLGYSDVTALHIFVNQFWNMPSIQSVVLGINGDISPGFNKNGISGALDVLTGETETLRYSFMPMNATAKTMPLILSKIVGGNLYEVSALSGATQFPLDTSGKMLFIESVAAGPGVFSRMLNGLAYSPAIEKCDGVIFGDVISKGGQANPPDIQAQYDYIIQRFANQFVPEKPVLLIPNTFGHGPVNKPLPFNTACSFQSKGGSVIGNISANRV